MTAPDHLSDDEVRDACAGLDQPAAMLRYLRNVVGVKVIHRKPNGMPLVGREAYRRALGASLPQETPQEQPNRARLKALLGGRA